MSSSIALSILGFGRDAWSGRRGVILCVNWYAI